MRRVLCLVFVLLLIGCGAEMVATQGAVAEKKKQEVEEAQKRIEEVEQRMDETMQQVEQRRREIESVDED